MTSKFARVYYDPANVGSYGGAYALWKAAGGTLREAKEWLETQDTYTLHRPARKRFPRNKIAVAGIDDQWEADLVDVQKLAKENKSHKYLLTVIDSLSKFAWAIPIKDKSGDSIVAAFKGIFKTRQPRKLRTDRGKEFLNYKVQNLLKQKNIIFFTSNNDTKAAMVERFNRTLRSKLWRYFTATKEKRYIDILPQILLSYNNKRHSTTGMAPSKVTVHNAEHVWRKMYQFATRKKGYKKPRFTAGDHVRISKAKDTFEKGYKTNWRSEIFVIKRVFKKHIPEYALQDLAGEDILGKFLEFELQRVKKGDSFTVSKIVRRKGQGKKRELLVEWIGYPKSLRTWIPASHLKQHQGNGDGLASNIQGKK